MRKVILFLIFTFLTVTFTHAQWINQSPNLSRNWSSVYFTDANMGYAVGNYYSGGFRGTILKTTNGGTNWTTQNSGTTNYLNSIYFPTANTGYAAGDDGTMLKTINGRTNWVLLTSGTTEDLESVHFPVSNTGYSVGDNIILKTSDGGNNWETKSIRMFDDLYSVCSFPTIGSLDNGTKVWSVGLFTTPLGLGGAIGYTTDGGANWSTVYTTIYNPLFAVHFVNANTGYAAGSSGTMLKTTNGGETWSELNTNTYGWFRSVNFTDANTGYTVGDFGIILKTTNGGTNWTQQYGGTAHEDLKSVKFVNANTGYVAGDNGTMLKTTNGGVNWVSQTPPKRNKSSTADLNSVYFIDANTGWIVGANGTILKTTNGGVFIYNISNEIPGKYVLHQNYPNPFNPSTTIIFDLPESGFVSLIIYDVLGREVVTLLNKELKAGSYTGVWNAGDYNSGVYFYRLRAGDYVETRKCLLIK